MLRQGTLRNFLERFFVIIFRTGETAIDKKQSKFLAEVVENGSSKLNLQEPPLSKPRRHSMSSMCGQFSQFSSTFFFSSGGSG